MPITGPSSYLPTTDQFIAHWTAVNAALVTPGSPPPGGFPVIIVTGNRALAGLQTLRTTLATARTDVELKLTIKEIARADVEIKRTAVLARCGQFNDNVRASWGGTALEAGLRPVASVTDGASRVEQSLDDVSGHWGLVNASASFPGVTLPLTLPALSNTITPPPIPYTLANFLTEVAALKLSHSTLKTAEVNLDTARSVRTATEDQIREYLPGYREAVPAKLPPDHPLIGSLPRYSPLPGSTPDAAVINGLWNSSTNLAVITFVPSPSASVERHELRFVAGPDYAADDETIVVSIPTSNPPQFETLVGLTTPGTTASYRVYAITTEGNERASNTVVISRPV